MPGYLIVPDSPEYIPATPPIPVPDQPPILPPEWGTVLDNGGAPTVLQAPAPAEGAIPAGGPTLTFFDMTQQQHRVWQAVPRLDLPVAERGFGSFPDYLVTGVALERDFLLSEWTELTVLVDQTQMALDSAQAATALAQADRDTARAELQRARAELVTVRFRVGLYRDDLEYVEGEYRATLTQIRAMRIQIHARDRTVDDLTEQVVALQQAVAGQTDQIQERDQTIVSMTERLQAQEQLIADMTDQIQTRDQRITDLFHQVQTRDSRLAEGMRHLRRSYREFEEGQYISDIPVPSPSETSVARRPRYYEPLEGSSGQRTEPLHDDDEIGGATIGGSAETPVLEPGWVD